MVNISALTKRNIKEVVPLLQYTWSLHSDKNDLYNTEAFAKPNKALNWLTRIVDDSKYYAYLAQKNHETVGFISLEVQDNPSYFSHPQQLFVIDVVVAEHAQGQGIAIALEIRAEKLAKDIGIHQISGHVDSWNVPSQSLMQKLGRIKGYEEWHKFV